MFALPFAGPIGRPTIGLFGLCRRPKLRLDIQLIHTLNQAANIVGQDFAKCLVDLCSLCLASEAIAKLCLDHAERRLNVAALVVLLEKPLLIELKVMVHLMPQF